MPQAIFDDDVDILDELESKEEDEEVLEEMARKRREKRQKSFLAVVNKKKLGKHELDEVML